MRRNFRPFFLDPKTGAPLPSKRYYDIASWLTTQLTFSFAAAPFLILSFKGSLLLWSRVYFYAVIGTAALMVLFASPAKLYLKKEIEKRNAKVGIVAAGGAKGANGAAAGGGKLPRSASSDSLASRTPVMGITQDLEKEFDDAMSEIRAFEEKMKSN
jgi:lysophospholipid acyltransferase